MNNKSFTMIELIVAMTIVLIISTIGTINYLSSYETLKLDAAAQRIASDIQYAQNLVINRDPLSKNSNDPGYSLVVDFSISQNSYYIVKNQQNRGGTTCQGLGYETPASYSPITNPLTQEPDTVDFDTSDEYKGVRIMYVDFGNNDTGSEAHAIWFGSPNGEVKTGYWFCSSGNTVTFLPWYDLYDAGAAYIRLSFKGKNKFIRIGKITGRVTIE
jgi:prepilin-type N-terminal cleavage/methylation domain-containing protein